MASVHITKDTASEFLDGLSSELRTGRGLVAALVGRLSDVLIAHFTERNLEPNAKGWRKSGFWGEMASRTSPGEISDTRGEVVIADYRLAQRVHGGTITAKEKGSLAFPIHPLAAGLRAGAGGSGDFSSFTATTGIKLFRPGKPGAKKNVLAGLVDGKLEFFYALAKSVTQAADPNALPSTEKISEAMGDETDAYLEEWEAANT